MSITLLDAAVVQARVGVRSSRYYEHVADGLLPPPVRLGRSSRWPSHEIDAVIAARIAGASDADIRVLVIELVAQRELIYRRVRAAALGEAA